MIFDKRVLAVIPARGGSKGIPRKNLRMLAGKPLLVWTIDAAQQSKYIDRIILSSEDAEIIKVAQEWGCEVPFVRPHDLARDDTPGIAPVIHALDALPEKYQYVVLLQPTSPLRQASDIDSALELCYHSQAPSCVSVAETEKSPYWMYFLGDGNKPVPVLPSPKPNLRRQDVPRTYGLNGAIYVAETNVLSEKQVFVFDDSVVYVMPKERSLDIDSELDLMVCELLLQRKQNNHG